METKMKTIEYLLLKYGTESTTETTCIGNGQCPT